MEQKSTQGEARASCTWEGVEEFVREHVQRLGRLLRKHGDKQAILYEVVTRNTAEEFTSERRRQHHAYR